MATRHLPSTPSFQSLRNQAKQLRRALIDQDPEAVERFLEHHPRFGTPQSLTATKPSLVDAQCAVAREYGFPSWSKLKDFVESRTQNLNERIESFLHWACSTEARGPQPRFLDRAKAILKDTPEVASAGIYVSVALGDVDGVEQAIERDPAAATAPCGPNDWPPIFYAAFSCFHLDPSHSDGIAQVAQLLLDRGADPNGSISLMGTNRTPWENHILVCILETSQNAKLVEILLKAGTDPLQCGAYYNTWQFTDTKILDLLYDHGAEVSGPRFSEHCPGTLQHRLRGHPEDMVVLQWFLERGADPNLKNPGSGDNTPLHVAVIAKASSEVLELLLESGADPKIKQDDGRSPVALAVRGGDESVVELLMRYGGIDDATPYDRLIGAAERNDDTGIQRALEVVDLRKSTREQKQDFLDAADTGWTAAVKAMLLAGMDIAATTSMYHTTALDRAALGGYADTVKFLVEQGAPLEVKHQWGGTPLGSALHALHHFPKEEGDYAAVVDALLAAGARHSFIKEPTGDADVDEILRKHGVIGS
jgi:ankyrin repeat protein